MVVLSNFHPKQANKWQYWKIDIKRRGGPTIELFIALIS
jgi:hypothetical protein